MHTKETVAAAKALFEQGLTYTEIGRRLGINRQTATNLIHKPRVRTRPHCPECGCDMKRKRQASRGWACTGCGHETTRWEMMGAEERERSNRHAIEATRRRRARLREMVDEAKARPCADCGEQYPGWAMHFHHLGDKAFTIGDALSRASEQALRDEIAKCVVLCGGCHRDRHSRPTP